MRRVKLSVAQITPGMKLAEPITNANGVTLMPAGIRLTPMFILRLKKWNIETLEVMVDDVEEPEVADANETPAAPRQQKSNMTAEQEEFARALAIEVAKWFVNVRDNPLMMNLRALAIRKLVLQGKNGIINLIRRNEKLRAEGS